MKLSCRDYPGGGDAGAPLVLLHGLFGSAAQWHHIAAPLSACSRIVELAQAGHWLHADQPAALVQLLAEWMEGPATGVPPACLVSSSLGPAQAASGPMFEPRAGA